MKFLLCILFSLQAMASHGTQTGKWHEIGPQEMVETHEVDLKPVVAEQEAIYLAPLDLRHTECTQAGPMTMRCPTNELVQQLAQADQEMWEMDLLDQNPDCEEISPNILKCPKKDRIDYFECPGCGLPHTVKK